MSSRETMLEKFWSWARDAFTQAYRQEIDIYLSQSTDLCDLERRIKYLELRGVI